jgi:hypothetical protein
VGRRSANYPPKLRERAVRMVAEVRPDYPSDWPAICAVASRLGMDAGVCAAVPVQQLGHPPLDILGVHLLPAGPAGLAGQVAGGEPAHRRGVALHCPGCLALSVRCRAKEPICGSSGPASSCLGCLGSRRRRRGMVIVLLCSAGSAVACCPGGRRLRSLP